ncbi:hypothetical protein ABZ605_28000 [Streptomyces sp. NPDC012765]|uniref:hypothetical protein n=1 Tax=Streptomyces sp. NPDC012765 TaxID=3155249 RepID=UPI0033DE5FF4
MSSTTVPTVARIVHYVSRGSADGSYPCTCRAALVTAVDETGQPALAVFSPEGLHFPGPLPHADPSPGELAPGTWHWPARDGGPC